MELDLQLTPRIRILLGILGGVLLIYLALQGGPAFFRLFRNQDTQAKREELLRTQHLVHAAEVLKPIASEIYKETGLAPVEDPQEQVNAQGAKTLFDTELPETVIRSHVDTIVKRAGIQQNYQLLTKPGTTQQTQKLTAQNRGNLVLYLYLKQIEAEATELTEMEEQEENNLYNMMMDAWQQAGEDAEPDKKAEETEGSMSETESAAKEMDSTDKAPSTPSVATAAQWKFAALPEVIPVPIRIKLASFIKGMITQQLRGTADSNQDFFETQLHRVETVATRGIFGIGEKPPTVEVQLRRGCPLLEILLQSEESVEMDELQYALVNYIEQIQQQRATLLEQLALAPLTYQTEHYTVEIKFKTDLEKLVNLNHLIETGAKWLTVRELRISADKQTGRGARGRNSEGGTNLNVDMLLIARIF